MSLNQLCSPFWPHGPDEWYGAHLLARLGLGPWHPLPPWTMIGSWGSGTAPSHWDRVHGGLEPLPLATPHARLGYWGPNISIPLSECGNWVPSTTSSQHLNWDWALGNSAASNWLCMLWSGAGSRRGSRGSLLPPHFQNCGEPHKPDDMAVQDGSDP